MPPILAVPAAFRMGDRNEIMDEVDGANVSFANPVAKTVSVQTGVTDVEIDTTFTGAVQP
jgi:hypothetical protein